jgi:5'-nucleotidase
VLRFGPTARLLVTLLSCSAISCSARQPRTAATPEFVAVQLLAFNDFHGNLDPPTGSNGRVGETAAGGVEYLATHLHQLEAQNPNTLIVAAGDLIGATPLLSSLFHDEPTIEALSAAGVDVSSVGNHEFDQGSAELLRMQNGGCHPVDGCQDHTPFAGATFQYLAANVFTAPSRTVLPPYTVKEIGGVKIGFIGLTLHGTPDLVSAAGIHGLTFRPEVETVNALVPMLRTQGVRAIVVLLHQGGEPAIDDYNSCGGMSGAIVAIAAQMSDEVDVIVSGHTHFAYICTLGNKLVTSAAAFGRLITAIDLRIDRVTHDVVSKSARNVIVTRDVAKDPVETAILDRYRPFHAAIAGRAVGTLTQSISRRPNSAGESPLGNVIADSMLESTASSTAGSAVIALLNPGGIRSDLTGSTSTGGLTAVTYADAFNVLPFRNRLVVKTLTGEAIRQALEEQFDKGTEGVDMILQVSTGFRYSYDRMKPRGTRVDAASISLQGAPVVASQTYRVALPDFLATGGDNFTTFTRGTDPVYSMLDVDALAAYLSRHSPFTAPPVGRITRIN